jgi:hypothetical protein
VNRFAGGRFCQGFGSVKGGLSNFLGGGSFWRRCVQGFGGGGARREAKGKYRFRWYWTGEILISSVGAWGLIWEILKYICYTSHFRLILITNVYWMYKYGKFLNSMILGWQYSNFRF